MIHLDFANIVNLRATHYAAVKNYVTTKSSAEQDALYANIAKVLSLPPKRQANNYSWLRNFILADVNTLEIWMKSKAEHLKFTFFRDLYKSRFATNNKFVDSAKTYNAYTLLSLMDIKVCPYCDDEYIDIVNTAQGLRRTADFDHFYPKGLDFYPGLAMCFFNLVPSGKGCNQLMNTDPVEANPYHRDIESWSKFEADIPVGCNLDSLSEDMFKVKLRTSGHMIQNDQTLGIEQRYNHRNGIIKKLLIANRDFSDEAVKELLNLGIPKVWLESQRQQILGKKYPAERSQDLHQKLKHDLTGW